MSNALVKVHDGVDEGGSAVKCTMVVEHGFSGDSYGHSAEVDEMAVSVEDENDTAANSVKS